MIRYEFEPAQSDTQLVHVGTYKRSIPVSLDRMYENALDWAHLPFVHSTSFKSIKPLDYGAWGWKADVIDVKDRAMRLELCLDRSSRRWITRNLEGDNEGAEIWTHVFVVSDRALDLVIDFFVPLQKKNDKDKVGLAYAKSYERLYDEDVQMMSERQIELDRKVKKRDDNEELAVEVPVQLPLKINFSGREYLVNKEKQTWYVYPSRCPHLLGPLDDSPITDGIIVCPWHGFEFDLKTGTQVGNHGKVNSCSLGPIPNVQQVGDKLHLTLKAVS